MKFRYQKFILGPYDPTKPFVARPFIPVFLLGNGLRTPSPYYALLDSGADRVIFPADLAAAVGITAIESGKLEPAVGIANQKADVYYHPMSLEVLGEGRVLPLEVGFSRQVSLPILGRSFFRHYKQVIFSEPKEEVELKP